MEQSPLETEQDLAKRVEEPETEAEKAVEILESPPDGDFIAGLNAFITWVQSLVGKKD